MTPWETFVRQRPFLPVAIFFSAGVAASRFVEVDLTLAVCLVCVAVALVLFRPGRAVAPWLLVFALGAAIYSARYAIVSENDLRLIVGEKPALATIRGRLIETPTVREFPERTNNVEYSYARIEVREILIERQWRPASGSIASTTRGTFGPEWFKGRTVEANGVIDRPKKAAATGLFDYREYLFNQRVFYQLRCETTNDWQLRGLEPLPVTERFQRWAHRQLARGLPLEDEPLRMIQAMALGTKQSLNGEVADVFQRTGTMHIFAISGLHVACIAMCVLGVLRFFGLSRDRAAAILIPLVWFYTLATGWQSSAVRSALMSTFVFAGWAIRRPTELLNSTAGAAMLILLFEPEQLFQASFQLSFAVVLAIALMLGNSALEEPRWSVHLLNRLLRYDPLLPEELRPVWKKWLELPLDFILGSLAISAASWLGSSPLTAYYFNLLTPISLIANLVAVPLSSISLAATLGSLLLPWFGPIFNYLSWATMWETIAVTRWLSQLSWGYVYIPKPNAWFFAAYCGAAVVLMFPPFRKAESRRYSYAVCGVLLAAWLLSLWPGARSTTVTVLAATGNPIFIDAPGRNSDLLIDSSNAHGAEQTVTRFLRAQGVSSLRNCVLTHGDAAHVGGFRTILDQFDPQTVFTSSARSRSRVYKDAIAATETRAGRLRRVGAGDAFAGWSVIHPGNGRAFSRADDNALVLTKEIHDWKVLFLSDLGPRGCAALLKGGSDLRADIVIMGLPDSGESIPNDLMTAISPRLVVFGGTDAPFKAGQAKSALTQLKQSGRMLVSTLEQGSIQLTFRAGECEVITGEGKGFIITRNAAAIQK